MQKLISEDILSVTLSDVIASNLQLLQCRHSDSVESRQRLGDMVCGNVKDDKKDKEGGRKIRHIFLSQR